MQKAVWKPNKTFIKKLDNLPGADFSPIYGKATISDSEYIFFQSFSDRKKRIYPYLVGEDERSAREIYSSIEPSIKDRAMEMFDKDMVRHDWNANVDYVGKLKKCYVVIGKELLLPKRFKDEVEKHERSIEKFNSVEEATASLKDSLASGKFFEELKQSESWENKLACILQKEGLRISDTTIVDISMMAEHTSYPHSIELMTRAAKVLKDYDYKPKEMHWMGFELYLEIPGHAYSDLWKLRSSKDVFIGEVKTLEPLMPCGKTHSQKEREWNVAWKKFREEEKRGLHRVRPKKEYDKNGRLVSITYRTASPKIPCGFIKGLKQCSSAGCESLSRGNYLKIKDADKIKNAICLPDEDHPESLSSLEGLLKQFYNIFDKSKK